MQVADQYTVRTKGYFLFDLSSAIYNQDAALAAETFAREAFTGNEYRYLASVWVYNDSPGHTDEDVLDVFDQAIARAREESL